MAFIIKKKYRVDTVAEKMRIATDTLYRYVRGENIMPPDRVIDLVRATRDVEYLNFFCEPNGYEAVPMGGQAMCEKSVKDELYNLPVETGHIVSATILALADGKFDKREIREIVTHIDEAMQNLWELKEKINREG